MTEPLRVGIVGPHGRMGAALCELATSAQDLDLTARVVEPGQGGGVLLADLQGTEFAVLVDFSHREAVVAHAAFVARHRIAWVLGTTGLTDEDQHAVDTAATQTAVFQASNFSVGVALLADLAARAARVLGLDADVEVVETHHNKKRDAPSGTALTLARAVAEARGQDLDAVRRDGRSGLCGERPRGEIGMHAVRLSDIVGEHEVFFAWGPERLVLKHDARDRKVFALGALRAARWLVARAPGRYSMPDLLA